ncbi:hypothetical protein Tco_1256577 [Tanacetum coccineum]
MERIITVVHQLEGHFHLRTRSQMYIMPEEMRAAVQQGPVRARYTNKDHYSLINHIMTPKTFGKVEDVNAMDTPCLDAAYSKFVNNMGLRNEWSIMRCMLMRNRIMMGKVHVHNLNDPFGTSVRTPSFCSNQQPFTHKSPQSLKQKPYPSDNFLNATQEEVRTRGGIINPGHRDTPSSAYNGKGLGHITRECPRPKRLQDSDYFKDKMLLMQAQESGAVLDEEQSFVFFLAGDSRSTNVDDMWMIH